MINFLTQNKVLAILLAAVYFLGIVHFHYAATVAADWSYTLTLTYYNPVILATGLGFSLLLHMVY